MDCDTQWFVCITCSQSRKQLKEFSDLKDHFRRIHDDRISSKRKRKKVCNVTTSTITSLSSTTTTTSPQQVMEMALGNVTQQNQQHMMK
jgi:hypothetical protein